MCQSVCEHVKEIEKEFWKVDLELDQMEEFDAQTV
jgi:hypothetical protein